jgi:hypothetical protein
LRFQVEPKAGSRAGSLAGLGQQGSRHKEVRVMRFLVGFLLGMLIGAFIALAAAPQPGSETRSIIMERVRQRARRGEEPASGIGEV